MLIGHSRSGETILKGGSSILARPVERIGSLFPDFELPCLNSINCVSRSRAFQQCEHGRWGECTIRCVISNAWHVLGKPQCEPASFKAIHPPVCDLEHASAVNDRCQRSVRFAHNDWHERSYDHRMLPAFNVALPENALEDELKVWFANSRDSVATKHLRLPEQYNCDFTNAIEVATT